MQTRTIDPFVPEEWGRLTGMSAAGDSPGVIVGPMDALNLVAYRDRYTSAGFRFGDPTIADVFLFSVGEAPSRSQTKIGGLPYLFKTDPWPVDSTNKKLPFVAQFDFRASLDLVGLDVEGDLLLIFGELPSSKNAPEVELIWQNVSAQPLVEKNDVPCHPSFDEFFGTRWRTQNYANAYSDPANSPFLDNGTSGVSYLACRLFATQIGYRPFLLSQQEASMQKRVLCCLAPVLPADDGPFPFLNEPDRLLEKRSFLDYQYDDRYRYVDQWLTYGDSTSLYILVDENGVVSPKFILG